jgi:hypothetical protein
MKRRPKSAVPEENPLAPAADAATIPRVKVWLTGISPMVWRRVLVPSRFTVRELHEVIQVVTGWKVIRLYDFHLRAAHYGSWEVASSSSDVTLAALRFRKGARFIVSGALTPLFNGGPGVVDSPEATGFELSLCLTLRGKMNIRAKIGHKAFGWLARTSFVISPTTPLLARPAISF